LSIGTTRRRSTSFGKSLILMKRPKLCDPCRGLIRFARMAFMQTEQLKSSSQSEEEDGGSKEGPKIKVQLANLLQPKGSV